MGDHEPMDIWSHREAFRAAVKSHRVKAGVKLADIAESIGLKEQTLKDYLYRKDVKPSLEVLQKAAVNFGCSITEFIDDPGASAPPGIDPDQWSEASERTRVLASAMFQDLRAIPEEEQQIYYELWKKGQEIGRARLAAEAAEKKGNKKP
jgi:transcriptional regulator with XRE-family HTH domain